MLLIIGIVCFIVTIALLVLALFGKLPTIITMNYELNIVSLCMIMLTYGVNAVLMVKEDALIPSLLVVISIVLFTLTKVALVINVKSSLRNVEPELNNTIKQMIKSMK